MKKKKEELLNFSHLLLLLFGCGIIAISGSGCGVSWQQPEFGGTGFRLGGGELELDGSPVAPSETSENSEAAPPGYVDWHLWGGTYGLNLDVALALIAIDTIKETLFTKEALAVASINYEEIKREFKNIQSIGDSRADLAIWGGFGDLQYEFPKLSFLPIPIVKTVRPYVGYGLGYLFKVDYDVETEFAGGEPFSNYFTTPFAGRGIATWFVAGGHVFSGSLISIRLEYQRLKSTVTLHASKGDLKKLLSVGGQVFLVEVMFNKR
jgi:hypothetical protein